MPWASCWMVWNLVPRPLLMYSNTRWRWKVEHFLGDPDVLHAVALILGRELNLAVWIVAGYHVANIEIVVGIVSSFLKEHQGRKSLMSSKSSMESVACCLNSSIVWSKASGNWSGFLFVTGFIQEIWRWHFVSCVFMSSFTGGIGAIVWGRRHFQAHALHWMLQLHEQLTCARCAFVDLLHAWKCTFPLVAYHVCYCSFYSCLYHFMPVKHDI